MSKNANDTTDLTIKKATIKRIKKDSPSEQVFDQLKFMIDTRVWKPGERIPSETVLANQFGVSRMTVRSATQKLSYLGLLEIQQGNGTYVKERTIESYISGNSSVNDMPTAVSDAFEIRLYLDLAAIEHAISRGSDEDIKNLETILDKLLNSITDEPERFRDYDIEFHRYIYVMSKNQLLLTIFNSIEPLLRAQIDQFDNTLSPEELNEGRRSFHSQLFDCIKARDFGKTSFLADWYKDVRRAFT